MTEYVNLVGSEDVSRAGYTMRDAAQTMQHAANSVAHALEMHQRFLDDWLLRLEAVIEKGNSSGSSC